MNIKHLATVKITEDLGLRNTRAESLVFAYSKLAARFPSNKEIASAYNEISAERDAVFSEIKNICMTEYGLIGAFDVLMATSNDEINILNVSELPMKAEYRFTEFSKEDTDELVLKDYLFRRTFDNLCFAIIKGMDKKIISGLFSEYEEAACDYFIYSRLFNDIIGGSCFPMGLYEWELHTTDRKLYLSLGCNYRYLSGKGEK